MNNLPTSQEASRPPIIAAPPWCGPLVGGPAGAIIVGTADGVISVPVQAIAQVRPVAQRP